MFIGVWSQLVQTGTVNLHVMMSCYTCIVGFILSTLDIWISCINLQQSSSERIKHSDACGGASEFACGSIVYL